MKQSVTTPIKKLHTLGVIRLDYSQQYYVSQYRLPSSRFLGASLRSLGFLGASLRSLGFLGASLRSVDCHQFLQRNAFARPDVALAL